LVHSAINSMFPAQCGGLAQYALAARCALAAAHASSCQALPPAAPDPLSIDPGTILGPASLTLLLQLTRSQAQQLGAQSHQLDALLGYLHNGMKTLETSTGESSSALSGTAPQT
jgi:hypothetical protein